MEAARSHNTADDGKTRERLFEGASSPLDTGQTTRCKTLSISCDRLLRLCDCSLLLSVVGSKCCVRPLSAPSARSVRRQPPARCHGGSDASESREWFFVFASLGSLKLAPSLERKDFPHLTSRRLEQEQRRGSLQTRPCCFSDHLARPFEKNKTKTNLN